METLIWQERRLRTQRGRVPARTTIYHYRNTLLHLGILISDQRRYALNPDNPAVSGLLAALSPGSPGLSTDERQIFARLVVANSDCRRCFFDLFLPHCTRYGLDNLLRSGQRVAWESDRHSDKRRVRVYNVDVGSPERWLTTEDEIQAVVYGVRYWARNELMIIDELFLENLGGVMYPIQADDESLVPRIAEALFEMVDCDRAWTTLSVRDLAYTWGPQYHIPVARVFATLKAIYGAYSEYVVLIPTAEAFATLTASSPAGQLYQLRSYLQDEQGRYVSHLRVHRRLKEEFEWPALSRV